MEKKKATIKQPSVRNQVLPTGSKEDKQHGEDRGHSFNNVHEIKSVSDTDKGLIEGGLGLEIADDRTGEKIQKNKKKVL